MIGERARFFSGLVIRRVVDAFDDQRFDLVDLPASGVVEQFETLAFQAAAQLSQIDWGGRRFKPCFSQPDVQRRHSHLIQRRLHRRDATWANHVLYE